MDCATCHACGGVYQFSARTLPSGREVAPEPFLPGPDTTCSVACHGADPATPSEPVAWNAPGPLACTSCHTNLTPAGATYASSHVPTFGQVTPDRAGCEQCHVMTGHLRGAIRVRGDDGAVLEVTGGPLELGGTCMTCHDGDGFTLAGNTPPRLTGYADGSGDFHGARPGTCRFDRLDRAGQRSTGTGGLACPTIQPPFPNSLRITPRWWYQSGTSGPWAWTCDLETVDSAGNRIGATLTAQPCPAGTIENSSCGNPQFPALCYPTTLVTRGFGGSLLAPYTRGQGALACSTCHDSHASPNAFLLASTVNGVAIPAGSIDRAGVGAEILCNACHQGDRHAQCKECHRAWMISENGVQYFDPAAPAVDPEPAGSPCFWCHGHEGIRRYTAPDDGGSHGSTNFGPGCNHCHSGNWQPATEYGAPRFVQGPAVSGITGNTATVTWWTNEAATSWVEYGVGSAGRVVGDDVLASQHAVTLTGLSPSTTYVWRVRSADEFRNVTRSALRTFTTPHAAAVPRPDVAAAPVAAAEVPTTTTVATLEWYRVTAPSDTAIEYEVQIASDPSFATLVNATVDRVDPTLATGNSGWISGTPTNDQSTPPRPALSFPVTLTNLWQDDCMSWEPNVYYFRVRARDALGNVSEWSVTGLVTAMASDPNC
jgi:predicted CXXCH cytochrome family protein